MTIGNNITLTFVINNHFVFLIHFEYSNLERDIMMDLNEILSIVIQRGITVMSLNDVLS